MTYNDWIGTVGVTIILLAYFLNIFRLIPRNGTLFYLGNIVGASLACYASLLISYWPFVVLEGTWALISIAGLVQHLRERKVEV